MAEPRRLKLGLAKEGKVPQQYYILSALFRGVPEFREAASWLKPAHRQDLQDGQYRAVNYRNYSVRSLMTTRRAIVCVL